MFRITAYLEQS
ncbi:hypothetical protein RJ640_026487 [Escallonia rubra]|uniref:Uncharacterized protein n=1 Tax=Escallonia rubra TaxID=112253 RepID=A0AA88RKV0_9ASTE|nr:hypothetical protein RJ640_026487 [Escallonia rubra]